MKKVWVRLLAVAILFSAFGIPGNSQRYLSDIDSSYFMRDTLRPFLKRFENLRVTGYIQPQFQVAQSKGAPSWSGGDFSPFSNSRFMLRRARVKIDYVIPSKLSYPKASFTFQIDATERGVVVRDMFMKLFENRKNLFSMSAGLFARPFGYEINLSSAYRETPERGRMSQILMPTERDLGAMVSFEPQDRNHKLSHFKLDAGIFNGQGLSGSTDFDTYKDFISRLYIKPYHINNLELSGGISLLRGGWRNPTRYVYETVTSGSGVREFVADSSLSNIGDIAPRHYYGADVQLKWKHGWGESEWRAEYWFGTQPGTEFSVRNPGTQPADPTYLRQFDGVFLLFLQNIINKDHQLLVKYDWFDPNTDVVPADMSRPGNNFTDADVKFSTLGLGYVYHFNPETKIIFYYDIVRNERSTVTGYPDDLEDNIFNCRLQFRF